MAKRIDFESKAKKYKSVFQEGEPTSFVANDIQDFDIIRLSKGRLFHVFELYKEFKSEEISELYEDNENEILPEHSLVHIFDEIDNSINNIPGDTPVFIYRKVEK